MPTIYELAKSHRSRLLQRESAATREILRAFQVVVDNLAPYIEALEEELKENPALSATKVLLLERYKALESQLKTEIERFSANAARITTEAQRVNTFEAFREAAELIRGQSDAFLALPSRAMTSFIGLASDGSPLEKIFADISGGAVQGVKDAIIEGIAFGSSKRVASNLRKSFGTPAHRALVISRQETLRAYKFAALSVYRDNPTIVKGWIWLSARSSRTCAVCWAMDGTKHKSDEDFGSHICCRCTPLPFIDKELPKTGVEIFDSLDAQTQADILGKSKYELYSNGKIQLMDLVETRNSRRWGKVRSEKALRDL
jgi:SPP1 gp7 family putative phage head morphogenesis protein